MNADADIAALRETERRAVAKIERKADRLQREHRIPRAIALGKAIESLPVTARRYLDARARLSLLGLGPLPMK